MNWQYINLFSLVALVFCGLLGWLIIEGEKQKRLQEIANGEGIGEEYALEVKRLNELWSLRPRDAAPPGDLHHEALHFARLRKRVDDKNKRPGLREDSYVVTQTFHSPVENVAGRDIIQNNVTSIHLLHVLETAVEQSRAIPEPQKPGLLHQIRSLVENPYISGLATSAIYDGLKSLLNPGQ